MEDYSDDVIVSNQPPAIRKIGNIPEHIEKEIERIVAASPLVG